jgi:hypothetical protein
MSKQTAVEFLIKEFSDILGPLETKPMQDLLMMDAMKQAKEMEKKQIVNAYLDGTLQFDNAAEIVRPKEPAVYYNETYGGDK